MVNASTCARFLRTHAVLVVSAGAALVTMAFVPPDAAYAGYFDGKVLACLFGILAVVAALRNAGAFESVARGLVSRFATCRGVVGALVGATLVLSMVATNDMALVMMLPLCAATLLRAGWERALPFAFIMQSLAANLGGMIVPFGNPQNLYLFERFDIALPDFLSTMALPFAVSVLLIAACCVVLVDRGASVAADGKGGSAPQSAKIDRDANLRAHPPVALGEPAASNHASRARSLRILAYVALLVLVVCSVFRLVPYPVALVVVIGALAVLDRAALKSIDLGLLLTFACFFVFAGNMARIPTVETVLANWMSQNALITSVATSQVISNVPAAILLSHVAEGFQALLVGVNIGGAGTLVASLASLITFNQYRAVRASFPRRPGLAVETPGRFVLRFTAYNVAFLVVLVAVCSIAYA